MSFLHFLSNLTGNVGRGAEDVFTLGGTEAARKFGGQGAQGVLNPLGTALGANFEAGAAGGGLMHGLGMGGASGMTPYMPTSTPVMGNMGSTLGPGIGSPLNLGPASGSTMGAAQGASVAPSPVSGISALQRFRSIPSMGGQQQGQQVGNMQDTLAMLYQMFPSLRPGAQVGQSANIGGMPGGY